MLTFSAAHNTGGLGVSLYLIHIYVSPLKRALQAFWLAGTLGMLYIMATQVRTAQCVLQGSSGFLIQSCLRILEGTLCLET